MIVTLSRIGAKKQVWAAICLFTLVPLSPSAHANVLSDIGRSISSLWSQKARKQSAARAAISKAKAQTPHVEFLHDRLEATQQLLEVANARYANYFRQMRRTERQLRQTRQRSQQVAARYKAHQRLFSQRLAAMQRHGATNYLQIALGSQSLSDLTRRTAFFQVLTQRDLKLQSDIKAEKMELQQAQNALAAQWEQRHGLQKSAAHERARIAAGQAQQAATWKQISSSRLALINYALAQQKSSQEIGGLISSLEGRKAQIIADYEAQAARERASLQRIARERAVQRPRLRSQVAYRPRVRFRQERSTRRFYGRETPRYSTRNAPQYAPRIQLSPKYAPRIELSPMPIGALENSRGWALPARGRLSSRFGMRFHPVLHREKMHTGDDIAASYGSPIRAAKSGRVLWAGWKKAYGNTVIVDVGGGMTTLYGHASKLGVRPGQPIKAGEYLGNVGSTGFSTGPHLHFEVRRNGKPIDPTRYLRGR